MKDIIVVFSNLVLFPEKALRLPVLTAQRRSGEAQVNDFNNFLLYAFQISWTIHYQSFTLAYFMYLAFSSTQLKCSETNKRTLCRNMFP